MAGTRHEKHYEVQEAQIAVDYITDRGQYHTAHYVNGLEMIFYLHHEMQKQLKC